MRVHALTLYSGKWWAWIGLYCYYSSCTNHESGVGVVYSLSSNDSSIASSSRRNFLAASGLSSLTLPLISGARDTKQNPKNLVSVYFGAGCFWHLQHEFILAETKLLNRQPKTFTARTGYAGGLQSGTNNRVCYHNGGRGYQSRDDYGKMGFAEVVELTIPRDTVPAFFERYVGLFNDKKKQRVDYMDKGAEYRSLIGLPGGGVDIDSPEMEAIRQCSQTNGYTLKNGVGNDGDTLRKAQIWVMDSSQFPFYQAEVYHQFHDDFLKDEPYGSDYNDLARIEYNDGRLVQTSCPRDILPF